MPYEYFKDYLGTKTTRPWGNNTRVFANDGEFHVVLHSTTIAKITAQTVALFSGGWRTSTTKDRINKVLSGTDYKVIQEHSQWYLWNWCDGEKYPFEEGITVDLNESTITGAATDGDEAKELIKKAKAYTRKFAQALLDGEVDWPSNGDCWFCSMRTEDGETLGDAAKDSDHLLSHIDEEYFVPSLLYNALKEQDGQVSIMGLEYAYAKMGGNDDIDLYGSEKWLAKQVQRALWVYLAKRLNLAL